MDKWELFQFWLAIFLGLFWLRRARGTGFDCTLLSAAIAAVVYIFISRAFSYPFTRLSGDLLAAYSIVAVIIQYPTASALTLFLGRVGLPSFYVPKSKFVRCALLLTGWMFLAIFLFAILKIFGLLILAGLFRAGMPRLLTRGLGDDYYLH